MFMYMYLVCEIPANTSVFTWIQYNHSLKDDRFPLIHHIPPLLIAMNLVFTPFSCSGLSFLLDFMPDARHKHTIPDKLHLSPSTLANFAPQHCWLPLLVCDASLPRTPLSLLDRRSSSHSLPICVPLTWPSYLPINLDSFLISFLPLTSRWHFLFFFPFSVHYAGLLL